MFTKEGSSQMANENTNADETRKRKKNWNSFYHTQQHLQKTS